MANSIDRVTIKGFKSIRSLEDFELRDLNVLIGANGAGKSNFVSFFAFLREIVKGRLQFTVNKGGLADSFLFLGPKTTQTISGAFQFGSPSFDYAFDLAWTDDSRLVFSSEKANGPNAFGTKSQYMVELGSGHSETRLYSDQEIAAIEYAASQISALPFFWHNFQLHDTTTSASVRRYCSVNDIDKLNPDGSNLAAFLYRLKEEKSPAYRKIVDTVRLVAPFFHDFRLKPKSFGPEEKIRLEWTQKNSDYPFQPWQLSDGTLRFIALATALLQPNPPSTMLIDEPELGLHPFALSALSRLIQQARKRTQLIIATQSASLLDHFEPHDIVVVDRKNSESTFRRLDAKDLSVWLDDGYNLGELWPKEIYGGGPAHE